MMRGIARLLFLVLIAVMVGANIPITAPASQPAVDLGTEEEGPATFIVGEGGDGLVYESRTATASDVLDLVDACGVYDPSRDYNVVIDGMGTGLAPPTWDDYADMVGVANLVSDVSLPPGGELPAAVDHSTESYFPIVDSQGSQGSCAAWATSYYTNGYLQAKDNDFTEAWNGSNKSHLMSPAWVYNKINYGYDSGSNWYRNHALMSSVGNADWETMPYNDHDLYGWGDEDAWRTAPRYRLQATYDLASTDETMVIKSWLAEGYVLPMAFDAYQYYHLSDDDIISSAEYSSNAANHANTIVGYNDSITADGDAGAFLIVNSWGKTWSGNGYWWMTYDALKELYWPVLRMYDYVDYEPQLIGTLEQSVLGSKDSPIRMGTTSGTYTERAPLWWAGTREYPTFMCLDITELVEDVGLADFYLYYGTGTTVGTVSSFEVEWYKDGYVEGSPDKAAVSDEVPKRATAKVYASFEGVHIAHSLPLEGTWHRGAVTVNGTLTPSIAREVLSEDFEGRWLEEWTTVDLLTEGGSDTWGVSLNRHNAGEKSAYCAGSDAGMVTFEDFDEKGFLPAEWSSKSLGASYQSPFAAKSSGYLGCGGSDYLVAARSDGGSGFNVTELLYTSSPPNATMFENLVLRFYIEYDWKDGDEYVKVLCSNASTYPNWTVVDTYTKDTFGYQAYDLSSQDGEAQVYLGFEYHGTNDYYVTVDDVALAGDKGNHDPMMKADLYTATGDLTGYDSVVLYYSHWVDTEAGVDQLMPMYRTSSSAPWQALANHSGAGQAWTDESVDVPTNATHVGFRFLSDAVNQSEGAYLDDVFLVGYEDVSSVEISVDGGEWQQGVATGDWSYQWNTTGLEDGEHQMVVRVNYSGSYDQVTFRLFTDNSPPEVTAVWNDTVSTGDDTTVHVTASDLNSVALVQLIYRFNELPEQVVNVTDNDNVTWNQPLSVPDDAVDLYYKFHLVDSIGNEMETDEVHVMVIDNDGPFLGEDDTPSVATTGDPLTFTVTGWDNIAVARVMLEYWYGDDEPGALEWSVSGDQLVHTIDVRHVLEVIHYRYTVVDTSDNQVTSPVANVTIMDNDLPVFGPDGTPDEVATGGNVTMSITATDNIEMTGIWVEYRFGDGPSQNVSLEQGEDGNWTLTVDVALDSIAPLRYVFRCVDGSGNWNATTMASVTVLDTVDPWFGMDSTPSEATTGDPHAFSVVAYDNIAIGQAWVEYWYGEGPHHEQDMTDGNGLTWSVGLVVKDTLLPLSYVIHVEDTSGNHNVSGMRTVTVVDDDQPIVMEDGSPTETTTGVSYLFALSVTDNLGIDSVKVTYRYDGGEPVVGTMEATSADANGNGTYHLLIQVPAGSTDPLIYTFLVEDTSGNSNATGERTVPVLDVTKPVAVAGDDEHIDQHQELTLSATGSSDNVGLVSWKWTFMDVDGEVVLEGETVSHTFHEAGAYTVTLTVRDPSGNTAKDTLEVTVADTTRPVARAGPDRTVDQNSTVAMDASGSTDNVAVTSWSWSFTYDGAPKEMAGQGVQFMFRTPGLYTITLEVGDKAGNSNSTSFLLTVKDTIDPVVVAPKKKEARVDDVVRFDGSRSTDNVGIVNWTWLVEDEDGGVEELYGPVVDHRFKEPGDYEVTLMVKDADGNTVVSEPFTVHVPNMMFWYMLILFIVCGVVATAGVIAYTRRKTRKLDEMRVRRR